ncbi:putative 2-aminoethylphosphonate ABC transporter substrate-binding protein [Pseudaminobacter sp. 19-2017]|uniref:2-aminoethylphosphonate ABC transporter substrate-binding protein n=1 Tax=Pseudaminobacter soli (ex Zhang et al. 2022) TaxID=2831468 RepID=A0A942E720_9HYPH|nr:putative 2-aminoethylphosphonate ABC transporter substrate-binding protein [Pseudaminobacter soli]MBS3652525.1 putative 2-aminoethylphosphonate ABC transporter substrate-binding protein [Pseudaminobacter soli]
MTSFKPSARLRLLCAALLVSASVSSGTATAEAEELTVYSAMAKEHFAELIAAFQAREPEIKVNQLLDSNGPIIARLLAEQENPRADIILGASVPGLVMLEEKGMLAPYAPAGLDQIKDRFYDRRSEMPHWVGTDAWASAVCYNKTEGASHGIEEPKRWQDLIKPGYKGMITMPNPNSSATGLLAIAGWMKILGEEEAWNYMDALHENIAQYVHSGSKPCRMAAAGEAVVGIAYPAPGVKAINDGAPLSVVIPEEGVGSEVEGVAIVAGARNPDAAKKLADFAASQEGNEIHNKYYALVARRGVATAVPNYPEGEEAALVDMDFYWVAANRDRILAEWQKRYGTKDEPK